MKRKICPIMSIGEEGLVYCESDNCAWFWCGYCSVVIANFCLYSLYSANPREGIGVELQKIKKMIKQKEKENEGGALCL